MGGWFIALDNHWDNPWYVDIILAPLFAVLATILIFMDQHITAVIVNRKEKSFKLFFIREDFHLGKA